MWRKTYALLVGCLFLGGFLSAQTELPLVGITTPMGEDLSEGSRLLLGQAIEQGLLNGQAFRLLDRRRLDAVFLARTEVRHEDYLASDRESIAALGAEYLLVSTVNQRQIKVDQYADGGLPGKTLTLTYRIRISLLNVATGAIENSRTYNVKGVVSAMAGESEVDAPEHVIITKAERYAANNLESQLLGFSLPKTARVPNEMQVVEVVSQSRRKVTDVLIANKGGVFEGNELDLYINESYVINGDTLVRPVVFGMARAARGQNSQRIMECEILFGETELKTALDAGQAVYAKPYSERE